MDPETPAKQARDFLQFLQEAGIASPPGDRLTAAHVLYRKLSASLDQRERALVALAPSLPPAPPDMPPAETLDLPRPNVRHCIYHVCPLASNDLWKANLYWLRRYAPTAFNGKKLAAIATGPGLVHPDAVREQLPGFQFLEIPNDPVLREVVSFLPLLVAVANPDPHHCTWYGHTKGNSTAANVEGATYWRNAMYDTQLRQWSRCMGELQRFAFVGAFKTVWAEGQKPPYPSGLKAGRWMLAGTFFWFRNDLVFGHPQWRSVPGDRYGVEAWPSTMFEPQLATSAFQLWSESLWPMPDMYDPAVYPNPIQDPCEFV